MIAEISVFLPGQSHMSPHLAKLLSRLDTLGVEHRLGPAGTAIRGESDQVFHAIRAAHQFFKDISPDLVMNINLIDRKSEHHSLREAIDAVLEHRKEAVHA